MALNGKKDLQVDWEPNLSLIDQRVKSPHQTVALVGMNHLFQHCQTGALTEYQQIEETIVRLLILPIDQIDNHLDHHILFFRTRFGNH